MRSLLIKNSRKAQMEMTMGTLVTIVLLTMALILGGYFVRQIFSGATTSIEGIDQAVKNEINKLFSDDDTRKIVVYPPTRQIIIKKGTDNLGFGFSIRNVQESNDKFSYEISAVELSCSDNFRLAKADDLIVLGKSRSNIELPPGSVMDQPMFVRFDVPETTPPCNIRYQIQLYHEGKTPYSPPVDVDVEIKSD